MTPTEVDDFASQLWDRVDEGMALSDARGCFLRGLDLAGIEHGVAQSLADELRLIG